MDKTKLPFSTKPAFLLVAFATAFLFFVTQYKVARSYILDFKFNDNDDEMRTVNVRDLLEGQGWFDQVQYRAMPPEGLSLHWSRLVDAPLAGLAWLFRPFLGTEAALHLAAGLWPLLLFVLFCVVTTRTANILFNRTVASFSLMAVATLPLMVTVFFVLGRVDHHNIQMLLMLMICAALLLPGDALRRGLEVGGLTALSLAVGLETLPFLVLVSVLLTLGPLFGYAGSSERLLGFGLAVGILTPLLMMAQTSPDLWLVPRCDQLSVSTLKMTTAMMIVAVGMHSANNLIDSRATFGSVTVFLCGLATIALFPEIEACREGPFSNLPKEVYDLIFNGITESRSGLLVFKTEPRLAINVLAPHVIVALGLLWMLRRRGLEKDSRRVARVLLAVICLGAAMGVFYQLRAILPSLAVLPLAFGLWITWMLEHDRPRLRRFTPVIATVLGAITLFPVILLLPLFAKDSYTARFNPENDIGQTPHEDVACSAPEHYEALATLSPTTILAPLNFGTKLLLYTPHSVFSVPYHRAPQAYLNGVFPYRETDEELIEILKITDADHVLVCSDALYRHTETVGSRLAVGNAPKWLVPVDVGERWQFYRVQKDEIPQTGN